MIIALYDQRDGMAVHTASAFARPSLLKATSSLVPAPLLLVLQCCLLGTDPAHK
eukprot:COSAG03_NODE_1943_length_3322_cov_2.875582_2_plen_54_part_00